MQLLTGFVVVGVVIVCSAQHASADATAEARDHYRRGTNAFNLGHYLDAVKEYEAAYQIKEDPALLFNIAQAYRLAGENESAVRVYKSFVHQLPDSSLAPEVEKRIAELQQIIDQQRRAKEAPPEGTLLPRASASAEPAASTPTVTRSDPAPDAHRPWYRDPAAMTLAALGVAALGAGVGLVVKGSLDLSRASSAPDLQEHDSLRSSGTSFDTAGYVTLGVGAALCAAAAIKWAMRPRSHRLGWNSGFAAGSYAAAVGGTF